MTDKVNWEDTLKELGADELSKPDFTKCGLRLSAVIPKDKLLSVAERLYENGFTLLDVSTSEWKECFLVTYHFDSFTEPYRIALRVLVEDKTNPTVPSIYPAFQGAEWHERESYDFFGVKFEGNPNLVPLLLPDDLPGPPPLRKSPESLASLFQLDFFGESVFLSDSYKAKKAQQGDAKGDSGV
jgi:NADH-quinone oxidoreductase subunit C